MKEITFVTILATTLLACSLVLSESTSEVGPHLKDEDFTTCNEFAKSARFNPYSVLEDIWVVFYYWGSHVPLQVFKFVSPSQRYKSILQQYLNDSRVSFSVNWTNPMLVMTEKNSNTSHLIVQMADRGQYLRYPIVSRIKKGTWIRPIDLNFKQIDNGKYIAYMECKSRRAYMMAKPYDVPKKVVIQNVAAKLGFRGIRGKSYLYQGHEWMPIPEDEDYKPERFYRYKLQKNRAPR